jgi:hypothetical protein
MRKTKHMASDVWKRVIVACTVAATIALGSGCSEELTDANSIGGQFIAANLIIRDTTIVATSSSTVKTFVPMDGRLNLVGKSGDYTAITAMQFFPAFFPQRDTITVVTATLRLRIVGWFGDSTGTLAFDVHKITKGWSQSFVTWDSVQSGFYESGTGRGSFSGTIQADTQFISIELDTAMVREWFLPLTVSSYGIVLVPTASSNVVGSIHGFDFDSTQFQPSLEVVVRNPAGTVRDTSRFTFGQDAFVGNIDNLATDPQHMYVQAGVVYRSTVLFDVSFIPRGAIINQAELQLTRNPALSRLSRFTGDKVIAAHLRLGDADTSRFDFTGVTGRADENLPLIMADVTRYAQSWVKGPNYGLIIRATNQTEFSSFQLQVFHNETAADADKRPRLRIFYAAEQ